MATAAQAAALNVRSVSIQGLIARSGLAHDLGRDSRLEELGVVRGVLWFDAQLGLHDAIEAAKVKRKISERYFDEP